MIVLQIRLWRHVLRDVAKHLRNVHAEIVTFFSLNYNMLLERAMKCLKLDLNVLRKQEIYF